MPSNTVLPKSKLRAVNDHAPTMRDIVAAFETKAEPRDKAVLVAIAASPEADLAKISELTSISEGAARRSVSWLLQNEHVFITISGGYIIHTAVAP